MYTPVGKKQPVINAWQLGFLSIGSALVYPYTLLPIVKSDMVNQDAWISLLLLVVYIFIISAPLLFLTNKFRGMSISDTTRAIMGKAVGNVILMFFSLFFIFNIIAFSLMISIFLNLYILPDTPTWAVLLLLNVPAAYAAFKGAGTIGRMSVFLVLFILITIIVFFIFGIPKMDFEEFLPILDSKISDINYVGFLTAARYGEIFIFFVFSFFLKKDSSINKTFFISSLVFCASFMVILVSAISVLGVGLCKLSWNPYFTFTRQVEGFGFLERLHSLNTLAWIPVAILKVAMFCYMSSYTMSGLFNKKSHKPFVIPVIVVALIFCNLPFLNKTSTLDILFSDNVLPFIILPFTFLLPLIMLIVYLFRRKKLKKIIKKSLKKQRRAGASAS